MGTVAEMIECGASELGDAGIPDARREASSLLELALGRDRTFLIAHPEHTPGPDQAELYGKYISRRAEHEPFHYIKGFKEFYGLNFAVSPAVLVPRPETEMLVEQAVGFLTPRAAPRFCEVGVGSGCISIAVLVNASEAAAVGLEISPDALEIARRNSESLGTAARLDLRLSDLFESLSDGESFDLVISNPPYVPAADIEGLQAEVRGHEPHQALTDGGDGLSIIRRIIERAPRFLLPDGALMLEFGIGQHEQILAMFSPDIWADTRIEPDLQGIPRTVRAVLL